MPVSAISPRTRILPRVSSVSQATDPSHAVLWAALALGICLSLIIAIMSAVARGHQVPLESREPGWVAVQANEQINDLKDDVPKLNETIEAQQVEIQKLWREVQTAQCQVLEIKNPTPVWHSGPVLKIQGESGK
jgi:hypothetical protein